MIFNSYQIIAAYEAHQSNSENLFKMLTCGIDSVRCFAFEGSPNMYMAAMRSCKTILVKQMMVHAAIYKIVKQQCHSYTYKEMKSELLNLAAMFRGTPRNPANNFDLEIVAYIETLIERIRQHQKEVHALESSVVTAYCPIVPYTGTLKKPFVDMKIDKDMMHKELKEAMEFSGTPVDHIQQIALDCMFSMCLNHHIMPELISRADLFMPDGNHPKELTEILQLMRYLYNAEPSKVEDRSAHIYYLWKWVYENAELVASDDTQHFIQTIQDISKVEPKDLYQAFFDHLPATESKLMDELDQFDAMQKFMKEPNSFENTNNSVDPIELFDLDKLLTFIYTNRRFRANKYTNMAFMNLPSIGGYIYYKELLIIQPKTMTGNEVNFLYVPVVDDLSGSQVVIIKYWRNGHIDILSQSEYTIETQGLDDSI